MAEYDLLHELRQTIACYKMLARMSESDPLTARLINELVTELEEQLDATEHPLAPKQQGDG
jgi:hypothetical protein